MGNTSSCPVSGSLCKTFEGCGSGTFCDDANASTDETYMQCASSYCGCQDKVKCPWNAPAGKNSSCQNSYSTCCNPGVYCDSDSTHNANKCVSNICECAGNIQCRNGTCAETLDDCCKMEYKYDTPHRDFACPQTVDEDVTQTASYTCEIDKCNCNNQHVCKNDDTVPPDSYCASNEVSCCGLGVERPLLCQVSSPEWKIHYDFNRLGECVNDMCKCSTSASVTCVAPDGSNLFAHNCADNETVCCDFYPGDQRTYCGADTANFGTCKSSLQECNEAEPVG